MVVNQTKPLTNPGNYSHSVMMMNSSENNVGTRTNNFSLKLMNQREVKVITVGGNKTCKSKSGNPSVQYARNKNSIMKQKNCTNSMDVLAWITNEANSRNKSLIMTYGALIHIFREKDFFGTESYLDDDIDMLATPETIEFLLDLEPVLWHSFGWSSRCFLQCDEIIFVQIFPACNHNFQLRVSKITSGTSGLFKKREPALELYPLLLARDEFLEDYWNGISYSERLIFPSEHLKFDASFEPSSAVKVPMELQIPREALAVLNCVYGNWKVFSSQHAPFRRKKICHGKQMEMSQK
jgi:hypothetical protein